MDIVFGIAILIVSVVIHEVSHGYVAYIQGDKTAAYAGRLTMNPAKHLDFFGSFIVPGILLILGGPVIGWAKPVPYNPYNLRNQKWGEALVAAAGPASNILIALIFGLFIRLGSGVFPESFLYIVGTIVFINTLLAIFNLIPIPPLDGSKILFSILPLGSTLRVWIERYSLILIFVFIFFAWRVVLPIVMWFFAVFTGLSL